uniref:Uncharacterized protein n=1 Tax=Arundo donax TaxID=35708 RepID=A0A0A9HHS3_ARUDO
MSWKRLRHLLQCLDCFTAPEPHAACFL